ncbi:MAG: 16S rRNA (adenine(1518)-N(6)/adenine(1519)-N(6))-dimethyltransferase RsmA [Myxococcota bacterium]
MKADEIREILKRHELVLHKDRGQNFLCDAALADALVDAAGVEPDDVVIEVGTGLGVLTRALAARARRVVTIEIDGGLVRALAAEALLPDNVELLHQDALRVDWTGLVRREAAVRVVANLPYSVSGPILRVLLDLRDRLRDWSVMLQRDVAERIAAPPGGRDYGSLAVLHALCVDVERVRDLGGGAFFPAPQVASRFVRIVPRPSAVLGDTSLRQVERVVRAAFGQRRKTLANALRGGGLGSAAVLAEVCARAGVDAGARAETLAPEAFVALTRSLAEWSA